MNTPLHHLVFCSTVQVELTDAELLAMLRKFHACNLRHHITGLLLYHAGQFVSVLEGPAEAVGRLYERIRADARHHNMLKLSDGSALQRTFSTWRMGFVPAQPAEFQPPLAGYFNPRNQAFLQNLPARTSPHLLDLLREFVTAKPAELVYQVLPSHRGPAPRFL